MPSTLLLSRHAWALTLAATVAKGHTRGKRGHHQGHVTTWIVECNAGTECSIVRIDKASAGQCQMRFKTNGGAVILVLDGLLGNNGSLYGPGAIVCLHDSEEFAPMNRDPRAECWYTILWFALPETLPTP